MGIEIRRCREQKIMRRLTEFFKRVILVIKLQLRWWANSEISIGEKIKFLVSAFTALPFGRGVNLYGNRFQSDNQLALLLLPDYVELIQSVRDAMRIEALQSEKIKVLDIGGNVGQFATGAIRFMDAEVVSYEPNPACWEFLDSNSYVYNKWSFVKKAVSETEQMMTLHYVPGKSAQGSFSQLNASTNLISSDGQCDVEVVSGPIEIIDLKSAGFNESTFNLVKLDVEGFELEAIKGLKNISFDFLLVEIAEDRDHGFTSKDVCSVAEQYLEINLLEIFSDRQPNGADPRNVLFKAL